MEILYCLIVAGCTFGAVGTDRRALRASYAAVAAFGLCVLVVTS